MKTVQSSQSYPMTRERNLILVLLITLALASWALLIWQQAISGGSVNMAGTDSAMGPGDMEREQMGDNQAEGLALTMGMAAPLFIAMWVTMMVAMMFPTAAPMILMFSRVHAGKRGRGQAFVPTWVFVGAYLLIWALFGVLAYVAAIGVETLARQLMWSTEIVARLGGVVLVLAGIYQASPLKRLCLTKCRSPLQFILSSWREGYRGAFRMGLQHGIYCLGCCWLLFVILFPLGIMNVAAMAVITLLIFAEKSLGIGRQVGKLAALALIGYGIIAIFVPDVLPIMTMKV